MNVVLVVNALASLVSAGSSILGVVRPGVLLAAGEPVTEGTELYARAYAVRAVPLGLALAVTLLAGAPGAVLWPLLLVAGLAQVGDSVIGARHHNRGMMLGAGAFALLHLASAFGLAR
ncbi:hypothetical protein [Streptacidiphilus anmyonensis]|uniref:hypothetical protein n=1 Tax=Streptacidiphilus anmyonensis TaxID=405782 RepID=UPI000693BB81|nr:hypothetical protein [Streptacidiphilus anmyonensis]